MGPFDRLLHLGNVVVDVVLDVPGLPERGGDVLASRTLLTAGGGFNVMVAAARQGLPVSYAGAHGSGPLAVLARAALAEAGIEVVQQPARGTRHRIRGQPRRARRGTDVHHQPGCRGNHERRLASRACGPPRAMRSTCRDTGSCTRVTSGPCSAGWPALNETVVVFFDPGPLAASIPAAALDLVMRRTDWLTCNAREAAALTGRADPAEALSALAGSGSRRPGARAACVLGQLAGRGGCWCA